MILKTKCTKREMSMHATGMDCFAFLVTINVCNWSALHVRGAIVGSVTFPSVTVHIIGLQNDHKLQNTLSVDHKNNVL